MRLEVARGPRLARRPLEVADQRLDGGYHADPEPAARRAVRRVQQMKHMPGVAAHRAEVAQVAAREVRVEHHRSDFGRGGGGQAPSPGRAGEAVGHVADVRRDRDVRQRGGGAVRDMLLQHPPADDGPVDVACRIHSNALGPAVLDGRRLQVFDQVEDRSVARVADPDPLLPARIVGAVRLGVGHVDAVVGADRDAARSAELIPDVEQRSLLVEDRDAIVAPVTHENAALGVERDRVRHVELAGPRAGATPGRHERAVGRVFGHPVGAWCEAMPLGDEDLAARGDHDVGRAR